MICPECETEYRQGFTVCSDCDVDLVESLEDVEELLEPVAQTRSSIEVGELTERFEQAGIPYVIEAGTALSLLYGREEPLDQPESWEARVYVAADFIERARELLEEVRGAAARDRAEQVTRRYAEETGKGPKRDEQEEDDEA